VTAPAAIDRPVRAAARRRHLLVVGQTLLLALLLVLGALWIDLGEVWRAIEALSPVTLALYVGLMLSTRAISALRWYVVATRHVGLTGITAGFLVRTEMLAEFATLWLQTFVGGEAVRIWQVSQRTGQRGQAVASVVFDRVVGTIILVVVCAPFLLPLRGVLARAELPSGILPVVIVSALAVVALGLLGLRGFPALRALLGRARGALRGRALPWLPVLVGITAYPVTVLAHWIAFPELAALGWIVTATVSLVPRLGRAVPLSLFGVSAVEGSTLVIGAWLGIGAETLVVIVALNLLVKYVSGGLGALAELSVNGTRFFGEVRRPRPSQAEELAERAITGDGEGSL
jgi:hypothetical protein